MTDFNKLKVEDIKQMIVDEGFLTKEQVEELDVRGKSQWVDFYQTLNSEEAPTTSEQFEFIEEESIPKQAIDIPPEYKVPQYHEPEWQDYVMSQFSPEELIDGKYPNVNGLRRVVELLLGEIVNCGPVDTRTTMEPDIPGKAVVVYEVNVEWKLNAGPYIDLTDKNILPIKTFRAVGSSWHGNTDDAYAVFPESIAETRAEGRALRRALRLGVVCSDELTKKNTAEIVRQRTEKTTSGNWEESDAITDNQVNSIKLLCERQNIDSNKFINSGSKRYSSINEVSRKTAANMIKRLNEYQNNSSMEIPNNILKG